MVRKTVPPASPASVELPTTQRAYTLRLRGASPDDTAWRDALWATHEAINAGAKVFGEWLPPSKRRSSSLRPCSWRVR